MSGIPLFLVAAWFAYRAVRRGFSKEAPEPSDVLSIVSSRERPVSSSKPIDP